MHVISARPFENHLCERLPCKNISNNNNNNSFGQFKGGSARCFHSW